ncbi:MAG: DUF3313 family protein [Sideroxydans sp.]|nr:DUF3313 family protein [Sideroxydans sp.]
MENKKKVAFAALCLSLLAACASLPQHVRNEVATDSGLVLIHQDKSLRLYERAGFDPARFGQFALERVEVQTDASLNAQQKNEQEKLGAELQAQLGKLITPHASTPRLRMDIRLQDIQPVSPALNMVSIVLAFVPLDTGAVTVETTYRDEAGTIQAHRIERLSGSVFNIKASFSEYGQHKLALSAWAQLCAMSAACLGKALSDE